jgi:hypothetical protein
METIIASWPTNHNPKQHVFLIKWKDYSQDDNTWETYENVVEHNKKLIEEYYVRNPKVEKDGRFEGIRKKKIV